MSKKAYVVSKLDLEYNDEGYDARNAIPVRIFGDKNAAEKFCREENEKWLAKNASMILEISDFKYSIDINSFCKETGLDKDRVVDIINYPYKQGNDLDGLIKGHVKALLNNMRKRIFSVSETDLVE